MQDRRNARRFDHYENLTEAEREGIRQVAEIARSNWRAELETKGKTVFQQKRAARPKRSKNENAERAKFASRMARSEFRRGYWSADQELRLQEAMARPKEMQKTKTKYRKR